MIVAHRQNKTAGKNSRRFQAIGALAIPVRLDVVRSGGDGLTLFDRGLRDGWALDFFLSMSELPLKLIFSFSKLAHALAQAASEGWELLRPEENENEDGDDNQLRGAEGAKSCEEGGRVHGWSILRSNGLRRKLTFHSAGSHKKPASWGKVGSGVVIAASVGFISNPLKKYSLRILLPQ